MSCFRSAAPTCRGRCADRGDDVKLIRVECGIKIRFCCVLDRRDILRHANDAGRSWIRVLSGEWILTQSGAHKHKRVQALHVQQCELQAVAALTQDCVAGRERNARMRSSSVGVVAPHSALQNRDRLRDAIRREPSNKANGLT